MTHHRLATSDPTAGVKYSPSAVPMTHWPVLRNGMALYTGTPSSDALAVISSGPSIHGMGVCSSTHTRAAPSASNRVNPTRNPNFIQQSLSCCRPA